MRRAGRKGRARMPSVLRMPDAEQLKALRVVLHLKEPDGRGGSVRTFLGKEEKYWPTTRCAPGFGPACTPRLRNLSGSNGWRYPIPEISFEISQDHLKAFAEIYKKMKYNK